ncbi:MAG: ethanolamine utilization protein EutN [Puniceicoccaceae bacterium]|jgi:microcompartment protein CcmK/EutM|nr:ethanolamine utilization protein EutN [Puniceicoccaceae bacterium]MBL6837605.1 ethanolamine utilization protein EutN [Puniceicoccaceae bacterium]MBL6912263.1 ethanolamine utilization protein EutN [Puniceicoccaceae bacterium]HAZ00041.1 ethanolamine utilization protein EutN [Opitutae bacterium]
MKVGKVIGKVTLSHADSGFRGGRFILVAPQGAKELTGKNPRGFSDNWTLVAYDNLGAGEGDDILYVEGAEAMQPFDYRTPLDAISVALIDTYRYEPPTE